MRKILLFMLTFVILVPTSGARVISGRVLADSDSTAVCGASCMLREQGDTLAIGVSDAEGRFSLQTGSRSGLDLLISLAGYSPTEVIVAPGSKDVDAGDIYMSDAVALGEVTVTGRSGVDSKGRMIVFPSDSEVKASSTSISLFQKLMLPGLEANSITRSLTVDRGAPMILINGVPSSLEDVQSLQPKEIAKIEYSRITPARYADKGTNGLISITLKKRTDGGSFYGWARSAFNMGFIDGNIRSTYHQGPSQFSLSYRNSWRNCRDVYDRENEWYIGDDFKVHLESNDRNPFNYLSNQIQARYNYTPSARTLVSATFNLNLFSDGRKLMGTTIDSELGKYDNVNRSSGRSTTPSLDLFVRHDFNDRNSLEAEVVGTLANSTYKRTNSYQIDGVEDYVMDVDGERQSLITELSYTHTFSDKTSLSGGFQNTMSHNRNKYLTTDFRPLLTENNNYLYARLGQRVGKVYLSLSTGVKMLNMKNNTDKRDFVRNLTTADVSWQISDKWNLMANFRYLPSIPSLSALTDYPQQSTPYLISNGNPRLKVAEYFIYNVAPVFNYRKFSSALILYYMDAKNATFSDIRYLGDRKFISQTINSRKYTNGGGQLQIGMKDLAGFGFNLMMELARYESGGDGWSHHLTTFRGSASLWWNKGPFTVSYWRKFPGKYLNGHYVGKEENGDALKLEYKPDKHWTLGAEWMYMFDVKGTRYPSWSYSAVNPSSSWRNISDNANMFVLNVTYSADFGSIFRSVRRSLENSDGGSSLFKGE